MAARLIKPLYVRYDARTGKTLASQPRTAPSDAISTPRGFPEQKAGTETSEPVASAPLAKSRDDRSIKVARDDSVIVQARANSAFASPATRLGESSLKVTRTGKTAAQPLANTPPAKSSDHGAIKVVRDDRLVAEPQMDAPRSPSMNSAGKGSIEVTSDDKADADARAAAARPVAKKPPVQPSAQPSLALAPVPPAAQSIDDPFTDDLHPKAASGEKVGPGARGDAGPSPTVSRHGDRLAKVLLHDKVVIEELEREPRFPLPKPKKRRLDADDDYVSDRTIIIVTGAVIATAFAFTFMLPSILTRDPVEPGAAVINAPAAIQPAQTKQVEPAPPVPQSLPAPPPAAAPAPAARATATASVEKGVPALRGTAPAQAQADRAAAREALVPAGNAAGRTTLTAAEVAAVNRGLQELAKAPAAITKAAPAPRPVSSRPALTDDEKAAIERGLKELEKDQQANP